MKLNDLLPAPRYVVCTETHDMETRYMLENAVQAADDLAELDPGTEYVVIDTEQGPTTVVYSTATQERVEDDRAFDYEIF